MANDKTPITIEALVNAPVEKVWHLWSNPEDIKQWNSASPDWHTPHATNDLRTGGSFSSRMEAKDGSFGFDFGGIYDAVEPHKHIAYTMGDGRTVKVDFHSQEGQTHIVETFDPESQNPVEMQQAGWQSILNNFKSYAESK